MSWEEENGIKQEQHDVHRAVKNYKWNFGILFEILIQHEIYFEL